MKRLVKSSVPGAVNRDAAIHLLVERAVLMRGICRELLDADGNFSGRRPAAALGLLLQWVQQKLPESVNVEPHPSDGIDRMVVPDDCRALLEEIRDGAAIGEDLFMLHTADSSADWDDDVARIQLGLKAYWSAHTVAARTPGLVTL